MLKKIIFVVGMIVNGGAFAQAENFTGASLAFNTGLNSTEIKLTNFPPYHSNSTPFVFNTSYTFALSPKATLAVGFDYDLTDTVLISSADSGDSDWLLKDHYSINIEPGYAFNENTLGYIKLAYHNARSYYKPADVIADNNNISGVGYGFGAKIFFNKDLFLNLEIQQTEYGGYANSYFSGYNIVHTITTSTIGIGYKF